MMQPIPTIGLTCERDEYENPETGEISRSDSWLITATTMSASSKFRYSYTVELEGDYVAYPEKVQEASARAITGLLKQIEKLRPHTSSKPDPTEPSNAPVIAAPVKRAIADTPQA